MSRHKARRKGGARERVFGCDLLQLLQRSGQAVPQVLRSCTEFVEQHGVVDGIYRLSGVASNIQRLRQEFESERCPDLHRDVYLQDIHCVSSLCKAYCRELPNPLLTYQLYHKFADAVSIQMEDARLVKIKEVLKELPAPHYRTLEFLMRHLLRMAAHSSRTNMHARNLAIVWAPNLLRSKDIEASAFNGTAAFMEVRVQSIVVEFILTHVEQLFGDAPLQAESPRRSLLLVGGGQVPPYHVPAALSQGDGPPPIRPYHTIIELSEHRRKGSLKSRNWRSLFHLGRSSLEAKRKGKALEHREDTGGARSLRPAKSMDSLSTVPSNGDGDPRPAEPLPVKPQQRRESLESCPVPPGRCREPAEGREEPPGDGSARSEPGTPRAGPRRPPRCPGLHISVPFSVTVPLHITANLSRLTRGLPCPALGTGALGTGALSTGALSTGALGTGALGTGALSTGALSTGALSTGALGTGALGTGALSTGALGGDAPEPLPPSPALRSRLSVELRDSFAFLDSPEPWTDGDPELREPPTGTAEHGEGMEPNEDGMESGCLSPGEPRAERGCSLCIEECMDEHFMAPDGTDGTDCASDGSSVSGRDLSPVRAAPEPAGDAPGAGASGAVRAGTEPVPVLPVPVLPEPVLPEPVPVLPVLPEPVPVLPEPVLPEPVPVLPVLPEPVLPEPVPVSVLPEPELPVPVLPEPVPVLPEPELPVPVLPVPVPVLPEPVLPEPVLPEPVPVLPVLPEPEPVLPMPVLPVPVLPEPVPVLPEPVPVLPELPVPVLPEPVPVLPEPAAGLRLATPAAPVLQARSVPVVPPKPQFARAPPEPVPPLAARPPLRRPRWSRSLDAEQAPGRAPLRRSRTYGEDPGPTEPGGCGAAPRRALGPGEEQ
ncbi:LOW QUALITY PROTEIN: rho GTPase-activating protein 30 [Melopsittacus undulatus]|uniref:LOW QUALITY PROTEIN: rho GTPase-activating protein 30 n=1 Tax=Melopsittacus undulatus TaxID=13146 RepID=UPI00146AD14B|nr:LOW QUALITY PROTEIN: rho GTPase-activating protein 30 [Melopsittacus undulatus]